MNPKIVIVSADEDEVRALSNAVKGLDVEVRRVDRVLYLRPPEGLDAIFLVLPASERWGARPVPGKAQVLDTTDADQREGMPPFVVTGVVLRHDDERGPLPETRLLVRTALEAARAFNEHNNGKIRRLGFWAVNLLNGVSPVQLAQVFSELALK